MPGPSVHDLFHVEVLGGGGSGQLLHQIPGHGCLVLVLDQEVVKAFPEVVRAEEVLNHSDDGRALAVGNDVENGVDLGTGIRSGN